MSRCTHIHTVYACAWHLRTQREKDVENVVGYIIIINHDKFWPSQW